MFSKPSSNSGFAAHNSYFPDQSRYPPNHDPSYEEKSKTIMPDTPMVTSQQGDSIVRDYVFTDPINYIYSDKDDPEFSKDRFEHVPEHPPTRQECM